MEPCDICGSEACERDGAVLLGCPDCGYEAEEPRDLSQLMMDAHRAWAKRYPAKAYTAGYTKEVEEQS